MKAQLATSFTLAATMLVASSASADKLPDPVSVDITSPSDGQMFEGAPATIDVTIDVSGENLVETVDLFVDDASVAQVATAPWTFTNVMLAEGMHTIYVVANSEGIGYPSPTISVAVVAGGETGSEGTGTDGGSGSETGTGTGTDDGPVSTPSVGSYCSTTGTDHDSGLLGLGLFALAALGLTRRRA
jgi:MYXO-CTERM domain-containing protein